MTDDLATVLRLISEGYAAHNRAIEDAEDTADAVEDAFVAWELTRRTDEQCRVELEAYDVLRAARDVQAEAWQYVGRMRTTTDRLEKRRDAIRAAAK